MYPSVAVANRALLSAQARQIGHEIQTVCTWMIEDDCAIHAECTCGWTSHDVRAVYDARILGRKHLYETVNEDRERKSNED